jgi:hypothetical protein
MFLYFIYESIFHALLYNFGTNNAGTSRFILFQALYWISPPYALVYVHED